MVAGDLGPPPPGSATTSRSALPRVDDFEFGAGICIGFARWDIFGFESFETNSFEQLCIDYANERLHNFFLMRVFVFEIELYKMQNLQVPVLTYPDNSKIIELLENKEGYWQKVWSQTLKGQILLFDQNHLQLLQI